MNRKDVITVFRHCLRRDTLGNKFVIEKLARKWENYLWRVKYLNGWRHYTIQNKITHVIRYYSGCMRRRPLFCHDYHCTVVHDKEECSSSRCCFRIYICALSQNLEKKKKKTNKNLNNHSPSSTRALSRGVRIHGSPQIWISGVLDQFYWRYFSILDQFYWWYFSMSPSERVRRNFSQHALVSPAFEFSIHHDVLPCFCSRHITKERWLSLSHRRVSVLNPLAFFV